MGARLIINADDFGLTKGINRAVGELYAAGAVTSATLMANGPAFEDAVAVARGCSGLGVGCHVVFVDGAPVCPAWMVPSLMKGDEFRVSLTEFAVEVLRGAVREEDLVQEGVAQVRRLQEAGIVVSHLDTHKHTHVVPLVGRALLRVARECGVGAVRNPFEPGWVAGRGGFGRRLAVKLLGRGLRRAFEGAAGEMKTTGGTFGIAATGSLDGDALRGLLGVMPDSETWEMVVHPGYDDADLRGVRTRLRESREVERQALLEVVPGVAGVELIGYGEL